MKILVKRAYDAAKKDDGFRILVDRLWPRGVLKEKAKIDLWAKEVTPTASLRSWFHEDPEKHFKEFSKRYAKELAKGSAVADLKKIIHGKKTVTLVTAVKDIDRSHIPVLLGHISVS